MTLNDLAEVIDESYSEFVVYEKREEAITSRKPDGSLIDLEDYLEDRLAKVFCSSEDTYNVYRHYSGRKVLSVAASDNTIRIIVEGTA